MPKSRIVDRMVFSAAGLTAALGCAAGALSTQAAGGTAGCPDRAAAAACAQRASLSPVPG